MLTAQLTAGVVPVAELRHELSGPLLFLSWTVDNVLAHWFVFNNLHLVLSSCCEESRTLQLQ